MNNYNNMMNDNDPDNDYHHCHEQLMTMIRITIVILWESTSCWKSNVRTIREGLPVQIIPKYRHCLNGGGGVWPLPGFLWRICPHALRALKGDHSSPKSDNFPTKVFLFPQNRSFNHIYLTFPLSKMILRTFVEKCRESHLCAIMGQMAQDAWIGGWGST